MGNKNHIEDLAKCVVSMLFFFFNATATTEIYTLSLHDALPILEDQLYQYRDRKVIVVTHILPIKDFTVQPPDPMWEYMNAFLGSAEYGELILKFPNVKYAVSRHVHFRKRKVIKSTEFICNCLGYRTEWYKNDDADVEVDRAIMTIEI